MKLAADAPLPAWMKAGWATGDLGIACYVGGTMGFLMFYATQAHGISPAWAGLALLLPRVIDVVLDPLMGAISDRTRSPMGRRRPYLLYGSIAFGLAFYLMFTTPSLATPLWTVVYLSVAYLLASAAFTAYSIPHAAMAAEMSTSFRERTSIVGYRMLGSRLGILIVALTGPLVFASQANLREGFRLFALLFGLVILLGGLVSFFATRDAPRLEVSTTRFEFVRELRALLRNRPFMALFSVLLLQNMAIGMSATSLVYFLTLVMQVPVKHVGWFWAGAASVATLATPLWVHASRHWGLGKRRMYSLAIAIEIVAYIGIFLFAGAGSIAVFLALYFLVGIGDAACQLAPHAMTPDTVDYGELHTGLRSDGMIFGAVSGCLKLGMAFGAYFVSLCLSIAGFVPGEGVQVQSADALTGVRLAFCLLPALLWVGALWLLRRYDLDEAQHDRIRQQLATPEAAPGSAGGG